MVTVSHNVSAFPSIPCLLDAELPQMILKGMRWEILEIIASHNKGYIHEVMREGWAHMKNCNILENNWQSETMIY
jgi:hypothetical protein